MQPTQKTDIRSLSPDKLKEHFIFIAEPAFRAKQVYEWLWEKSCTDFEEMSNLSKPLREKLKETFTINNVRVQQSQYSSDKTIKSTFMLFDNNIIEVIEYDVFVGDRTFSLRVKIFQSICQCF